MGTKDQYFRVKAVNVVTPTVNPLAGTRQSRQNMTHSAASVPRQDHIPWTGELLQQHQEWSKSFTNAVLNSPDKATVDSFVANLISKRDTPKRDTPRRLACETSPFVDFLSVLAIFLPLMFLIYWMFLRRIYYPSRNKPTVQKTVKAPIFRTAL